MATTIAELLATLGLDASGFNKGVDQAESKGNSLHDTMLRLSSVGGGVVAGALGTAAAGAVILGKELTGDVAAAADAQKVQAQLEAVLKSTGYAAGVTADQADILANSLSNVTAFDDEAIKSGESMLLTFTNIGKDVFPQATETVLDMSQALGQDLQSSAIQLGKALNDPLQGVTALRRVGVQLSDEQEAQVKAFMANNDIMSAQKVILGELTKEFGKSARAAGSTFAGQMTILQTKIGNIRESIGASLMPALANLAGMFSNYIMRPEVQLFIGSLANTISYFAQKSN